jgi:hypothetical protein
MTFHTAFVFDPIDGRILRRTICSDEDKPMIVEALRRRGEAVLFTTDPAAGRWDDTTHKVVDGHLVRVDGEER